MTIDYYNFARLNNITNESENENENKANKSYIYCDSIESNNTLAYIDNVYYRKTSDFLQKKSSVIPKYGA